MHMPESNKPLRTELNRYTDGDMQAPRAARARMQELSRYQYGTGSDRFSSTDHSLDEKKPAEASFWLSLEAEAPETERLYAPGLPS